MTQDLITPEPVAEPGDDNLAGYAQRAYLEWLLAAGEEIDQVLLRLDRRGCALARIRHSSLLQRARPDRPRLRILADAA